VPLILLVFVGPTIVLWWTKSPAAIPSFPLLLACVLYASASAIGDIYSNSLIAMNYVRFISITKFLAGVAVVAGGYIAGIASQSSALIAFIQFSFGALIPALLFWRKMKNVLHSYELDNPASKKLTQVTSGCIAVT